MAGDQFIRAVLEPKREDTKKKSLVCGMTTEKNIVSVNMSQNKRRRVRRSMGGDGIFDEVGLVRYKHWLVYGYKHGVFINWPMFIKLAVVAVWNFISCRLFGHDAILDDVCINCCKKNVR